MWDMRVDMLRWNIIIRILLKFLCKHKNIKDPYILACTAQHVYGSQQARPRLKHWNKIQWSMNSLRGKEINVCEIFCQFLRVNLVVCLSDVLDNFLWCDVIG